jgi:hypothetical protein
MPSSDRRELPHQHKLHRSNHQQNKDADSRTTLQGDVSKIDTFLRAAEDAASGGELSPTLAENAGEVLKIAVNLVPQSANRRLSIGNVSYGEEARSTFDARSTGAESNSYQLTMQRYGYVLITISTKG